MHKRGFVLYYGLHVGVRVLFYIRARMRDAWFPSWELLKGDMSEEKVSQRLAEIERQLAQLNRHDCNKHAEDWHGQIHCGKCGRLIR